jgi:hypothetical protein
MGQLDAFQLGEALRLPFLHAGVFLGELRGGAHSRLGLWGRVPPVYSPPLNFASVFRHPLCRDTPQRPAWLAPPPTRLVPRAFVRCAVG